MKFLRRLYYRVFKRYRRLELQGMSWEDADNAIMENPNKPEGAQWHIAPEEDNNRAIGLVWMERRVRITE